MALADPYVVTISGSAISMPNTNVGNRMKEYTSADGLTKVTARHETTKSRRERSIIRIDQSKWGAQLVDPTLSAKYSMSCTLTFDTPEVGFTDVEAKAVWDGFAAKLAASSGADITKLLGGES